MPCQNSSLRGLLPERAVTFAFMTISDYYLVMSSVGIAELKRRLSEHLRGVRAGRSLTVLDRATPIARIIPYEQQATPLRIRKPATSAPKPGKVKLPRPAPLTRDVVELLLQDRGSGR